MRAPISSIDPTSSAKAPRLITRPGANPVLASSTTVVGVCVLVGPTVSVVGVVVADEQV